jgi:hypothetical protein
VRLAVTPMHKEQGMPMADSERMRVVMMSDTGVGIPCSQHSGRGGAGPLALRRYPYLEGGA